MNAIQNALPSCIGLGDRVVCFDGVCKMCAFWAKFIHKNEPAGVLKLAALQSDEGRAIATWCGLPEGEMNTMIFIDRGTPYFKSGAALRVVKYLRFPLPLLSIFLVVPSFFRDYVYNRVAQNRYRIFGRDESCMVPAPELKKRFVKFN